MYMWLRAHVNACACKCVGASKAGASVAVSVKACAVRARPRMRQNKRFASGKRKHTSPSPGRIGRWARYRHPDGTQSQSPCAGAAPTGRWCAHPAYTSPTVAHAHMLHAPRRQGVPCNYGGFALPLAKRARMPRGGGVTACACLHVVDGGACLGGRGHERRLDRRHEPLVILDPERAWQLATDGTIQGLARLVGDSGRSELANGPAEV